MKSTEQKLMKLEQNPDGVFFLTVPVKLLIIIDSPTNMNWTKTHESRAKKIWSVACDGMRPGMRPTKMLTTN